MGDGCRSDHVGSPGSDAGADRHHALTQVRLGKGYRGMCHALFVVGTKRGEPVPLRPQRFTKSSDVAMAENCKHATEVGRNAAVFHLHAQGRQVFGQRLRHRQSDGCHRACLE